MKKLEKILKQKPVYIGNWDSKIDVIGDFEDIHMTEKEYKSKEAPYPNVKSWLEKKQQMKKAIEKYKNIKVLFAYYIYEDYSGDAFVLFKQDGKLFEVNGSHCSCNGLEGQWSPEPTTLEVLEHRLTKGTMGTSYFRDEQYAEKLKKFLGIS